MENVISFFCGISLAIYGTSGIWGSLISYFILNQTNTPQKYNCGINFDPTSHTAPPKPSEVTDTTVRDWKSTYSLLIISLFKKALCSLWNIYWCGYSVNGSFTWNRSNSAEPKTWVTLAVYKIELSIPIRIFETITEKRCGGTAILFRMGKYWSIATCANHYLDHDGEWIHHRTIYSGKKFHPRIVESYLISLRHSSLVLLVFGKSFWTNMWLFRIFIDTWVFFSLVMGRVAQYPAMSLAV